MVFQLISLFGNRFDLLSILLCNASEVFVDKLVALKNKEKATNDSGEGRGQGYGTRGGLFNGSHQDEGHAECTNNMAKRWLRLGPEVPLFSYVQILVVVGKSPVLAYSHST